MVDLTRLLLLLRRVPLTGRPANRHTNSDTGRHAGNAPLRTQATSLRAAQSSGWTFWDRQVMAGLLGLVFGLMASAPLVAWARQDAPARQVEDAPMGQVERGAIANRVALSTLPRQAQDVHQRILAGGPFRYEKDGVVFGNRERLLPRRPRGFYREYTVPTPGERDRGARRIVCGGKEVRQPETCFYTRDHYASFQTIDPRH